ncbi:MAG: DUF3298 and DUF4163 domain-containing protein [Bacteroidales bacterium]|nr:DUF3298 and DUF4163 domain-containing protein [Bacteroidales bacterium]
MKLKITIWAAFCGLLLVTSCKQANHSGDGTAEENPYVQRLVLNERILLEETGGPTCTLLLDMDFFSGEDFSALNRAVIEEAFAVKDKVSFITAAARYRDTVQENFRRDWEYLRNNFPAEETYPFSYEYILNGRILDTGRIYQTYRLEKYTYLGGAHGMTMVKYFNFLNGKEIGMAEAFGENYQEKLGKLLLDCLMAKEGVQTAAQLAEQGYWIGEKDTTIAVGENFHCTEDTCFFFYQPYELAAGYKGVVEIPVPQAKLREVTR